MIAYTSLLDKIKLYVESFISQDSAHCYHGMEHTREVVVATIEMAEYYKLSEEDYFIVVAAAYFHDLGYSNGGNHDHEQRSALLAEDFLNHEEISPENITKVKDCIKATKMPQSPSNLLESIICDADLFHLGSADFKEKSKLVHQEIETTRQKKIGKSLWRQMTITLMQEHTFHTDYAKNKLEEKKKENLEKLL